MKSNKKIDISKKELILRVSSKVFAKQGFHQAKVNDIAQMAGIGTGTVYLYFETKENILKELMVQIWTTIANEIEQVAKQSERNSVDKVYECAVRIINLASSRKEIARMVLQEYAYWNDPNFEPLSKAIQKTRDLLKFIIDQGIEKKEIDERIVPEYALPFLIGGVWHLVEFVVQQQRFKIDNVLEEVKILVYNMFAIR